MFYSEPDNGEGLLELGLELISSDLLNDSIVYEPYSYDLHSSRINDDNNFRLLTATNGQLITLIYSDNDKVISALYTNKDGKELQVSYNNLPEAFKQIKDRIAFNIFCDNVYLKAVILSDNSIKLYADLKLLGGMDDEKIPTEIDSNNLISFAGHRGFGANQVQSQREAGLAFPENSLISFIKVMESGADFIEFDLHLSKDQHLMVIHDDDLSINASYIVQAENEMSDGKGGYYSVGAIVKFPLGSTLVSKYPVEALQKCFDISGNIIPPEDVSLDLYKKIPEFCEVLELVSTENAKRLEESRLPRIGLNIELKGIGTGAFVQKDIEGFNAGKEEKDKIYQKEIFYISFLDAELATIAGLVKGSKGAPVPSANLILGVPTAVQYTKVGRNYEIIDSNLNKPQLKRYVESLHNALKILPGRESKGLTGVDVSMWDVSDDSIEYFCKKLGIPIHLAVVPFGREDFGKEEILIALHNIKKIVAAQSKYFSSDQKIIVKTDNPALLQKILKEKSKQTVTEIEILEPVSKKPKTGIGIKLFPKPGTI